MEVSYNMTKSDTDDLRTLVKSYDLSDFLAAGGNLVPISQKKEDDTIVLIANNDEYLS